ncbi:hypothetical protein P8452_58462 [Trifolium repens]|nr:embryo-specific protein ATS3B [Trifolium repens]WJX74858.1 hypothetical protein P8452_58462 [Trifolium repens]
MKTLTLILTFSIIVFFSHATPILVTEPQPQLNQSSSTQQQNETKLSGSCNYMVNIKTSCNSPSYTKDEISLLFGDAHNSQVYVPRLDDPDSGTFEQCITNELEILGPCIKKICKLYLFRNGTDGWIPETVTAYDYDNPPVKFYYNIGIPEDAGYGYNYCDNKA